MRRYQGKHVRKKPLWPVVRRVLILSGVLFALAYPFLEPAFLTVEEKTIPASELPDGVDRLRVVYLTDIHDGAFVNSIRLDMLVRRVNLLSADIVVLGGDYRDTPENAIRFFETMPRINARYAVCAVLGSNDRPPDGDQMNRLLSAMYNKGVTPLINEVLPLRLGEGTVYIAGTDDVKAGQPNIAAVASGLNRGDYVIYASHSPSVIPASISAADASGRPGWYDLGLFGETHGGQIAFAGNLLQLSDVSDRYRQGWLTENRINLLISRGVGMSVVPVRLFCPPQIHLVTLVND